MCPARWGGCVWLKKLKPCWQVFVGRLLYQFYFPGSIGNWKGFVDSRLPWCAEFVDTAVSNFDIFNWIKYFGINNYSGFFDKRSKKESIQKKVYMWLILMNIKPDVLEYFVSFGLNCPTEVIQWSDNLRLNYLYNSTQYQNLSSFLWGYYCLCCTNNWKKHKYYCNVIRAILHIDTNPNEKLIKHDFKISKVNPWFLWIVNAHASLSGSCCLSFIEFPACTDIVTGDIGTNIYHWIWQQQQADLRMAISLS